MQPLKTNMETFMTYLLLSLLLLLSLYLIFFIHKKGNSPKSLPPGSLGWPVLGENLRFSSLGFQKLVREKMQKDSPQAFKTSLFGGKIAVLCGAEGNKFILSNDSKLFKPWYPPSFTEVIFPELDRSQSMETEEHFNMFRYDALKPDALKQYIPVMGALAGDHLDGGWRRRPEVKALPLIKKYAFELVCRLFMNVVDPERLEKLLEPFDLMCIGLVCLPLNLPGTDFSRALRGGKVVRDGVMRMVRERIEEREGGRVGEGNRDFLSRMVMARDKEGRYISESIICNVMVGLTVANQYEVSHAITIVVYYLAQLPHVYDKVLQEQMDIAKSKGPNETLAWEDVEKMKYTWNVVRESFRLTPPSLGSFREAITKTTFAGYTIPKGWKVMWSGHSSHMNPDYFPKPEIFDPSRFEGSGPAPYTFIPFGAGLRMCPGMGLARLVIMIFIHNLVIRFGLEMVIPNEKMLFHRDAPAPAHGLPLRLHPHQD